MKEFSASFDLISRGEKHFGRAAGTGRTASQQVFRRISFRRKPGLPSTALLMAEGLAPSRGLAAEMPVKARIPELCICGNKDLAG